MTAITAQVWRNLCDALYRKEALKKILCPNENKSWQN
jgi:hypothetical protein